MTSLFVQHVFILLNKVGTSSDDPGLEILINKIQFSDVFFSDVFSFNTWHCDIYLDSVHFIICNSIINNNSDQIQ